jgi:hypothetical protein
MSFSPFLTPLQLLTLPSGRDAWREPVEICRITNTHWKCTGARVVSNISNIALQKDGMEEIHHQTIINGLGNTLHTNTSTGNINPTKHYQFGTLNQGFFEVGLPTGVMSEHTHLLRIFHQTHPVSSEVKAKHSTSTSRNIEEPQNSY